LKRYLTVTIIMLFMISSCLSTEEHITQTKEEPFNGSHGEMPDESEILSKMEEYFKDGLDKICQGAFSEGIKQLVNVLAEYSQLSNPSKQVSELALKAEKELTKLSAALFLAPDPEWLDENGNQKPGETVNRNIQPSVILTIRLETGRFSISNAPIVFEFVKGAGVLTGFVNTNSSGQAGCTIGAFDNPLEENIVRASLVYRVRDFEYRFKDVFVDFFYLPPEKQAAILVLEKSEIGSAVDPVILDPVFNTLSEIDFDFSHYNGVMDQSTFFKIFEGDLNAIGKMNLAKSISYLIVILNNCYSVRKLGTFELYVADARATLRIIRISDGKIMYQVSVERAKDLNTNGQGGTKEKAVLDVFRNIAEDMVLKLKADIENINQTLTGAD
jgi:hypothetical protein